MKIKGYDWEFKAVEIEVSKHESKADVYDSNDRHFVRTVYQDAEDDLTFYVIINKTICFVSKEHAWNGGLCDWYNIDGWYC